MMQWMLAGRFKWITGVPVAGALLALMAAYGSEWFLGFYPCEMCLWQRIPYALILLLAVVLCALRGRGVKIITALMVLLLGVEVILAVYHSGVEWRWWEGMTSCSMGLGQGLSVEDMLNRIMNASIISCAEPPFRFLGLSMAGWNAVYALALLMAMGVMGMKETRDRIENKRHSVSEAGFSLVELSLVMVVIGLLVGGVMGGRHLIRAAELRAVTSEYETLLNAVRTFELRYDALPGDFRRAETHWGTAATCPPVPGSVVVSGTCNGNGNGRIGDHNVAEEIYEQFTAWQQLSYAGLIHGSYTGAVGTATTYHSIVGVNVPDSKITSAGWSLRFRDHFPVNETVWFVMDYGNAFVFGGQTDTITVGETLMPREAYHIDLKFDDGLPAQGKIIVRSWGACTNAANNTAFDAVYRLTSGTKRCSLSFRESV